MLGWGFCDIWNNQGQDNVISQDWLTVTLSRPWLTEDITKTKSTDCVIIQIVSTMHNIKTDYCYFHCTFWVLYSIVLYRPQAVEDLEVSSSSLLVKKPLAIENNNNNNNVCMF